MLGTATAHEIGLRTAELASCSKSFLLGLEPCIAKGLSIWAHSGQPHSMAKPKFQSTARRTLGREMGVGPCLHL